MTVSQTSLEAYAKLSERKIAKQEMEVLNAIVEIPFPSNADIGRAIGLPNSTVSARTNAMEREGWIRRAGRKVDPNTRTSVFFWTVVV